MVGLVVVPAAIAKITGFDWDEARGYQIKPQPQDLDSPLLAPYHLCFPNVAKTLRPVR